VAVVGFVAAVSELQAAVAQDAQLDVPLAWELGPVQDVPQAALLVVQDVPQAALLVAQDALPVRNAALVARSDASPGDPQDDQPDDCLAARCSAALPGDPQAGQPVDCSAARCSAAALPGDPQDGQPDDYSAAHC
jgi:hypothetical protein